MATRVVGLVMVLAGVALGAAWASGRLAHPFAPAAALLLLGSGGLLLPRTHLVAQRMRPLAGKIVRVQAWSADLPGHPGAAFRLDVVRALGAALHFYLAPLPQGKPVHMKVAQPRDAAVDEHGVEIAGAKYIQWDGRKLAKSAAGKALVLKTVDSE